MTRTELINQIIKENDIHSYLEIGVQNKDNNFNHIICEYKFGVDPDPASGADFIGDSDYFFKIIDNSHAPEGATVNGLVFIDGFHECKQVERDIINSIKLLKPKFILLHDCNPLQEIPQRVPRQTKVWYGNVWRAFVGLRIKYPQLKTYCHNFDCGCGVIEYNGENIEPGFSTDMPWLQFDSNRTELLGLF